MVPIELQKSLKIHVYNERVQTKTEQRSIESGSGEFVSVSSW